MCEKWALLGMHFTIRRFHFRRSLESTTADIAYWEKDGNNRKPAEEEEEEEDSNDHIIDKTESAVEKPHLGMVYLSFLSGQSTPVK